MMTQQAKPTDPVLVVEDTDDSREVMGTLLEMEGYRVAYATDGRDALDKLETGLKPCLILLDLFMPVKNGWEFRAVQRSDPRLADLPVAVLSGDNEVAQVAAQLGAAGYLSKPISLEALLALVAAHQGRPKI